MVSCDAPASRPPDGHSGGRLWQNGRFALSYDKLGPCLGSGGMGSVWAARVGNNGVAGFASVGSWVAVKAIPMELEDCARDAGSTHSGLRECLSTFKDLSPVHVVRYERYWLEAVDHLPVEVREFCKRGRHPCTALAAAPTSGCQAEVLSMDSSIACLQSSRFHDPSSASGGLSRRPRLLSRSSLSELSCGFVFESDAGDSEVSPEVDFEQPVARKATNLKCAVLLIEMELMGPPPDSICSGVTKEGRMTLRAWLQRQGRTYADAADVFGPLVLSIRHIHRKRIVHADLKPDNIFCVEERGRVAVVRIGDFGLAGENQLFRQFDQISYGMRGDSDLTGGTPGYVAPEIKKSWNRGGPKSYACSDKVDIFACAVVLLELLLPPFTTQMERVEILERFHSQTNVPDSICVRLPKTRALLQEMKEHDPTMRLSAEEVCKRFEKEVRKELCRSVPQLLCSSKAGDCAVRRPVAPIVQEELCNSGSNQIGGQRGNFQDAGQRAGGSTGNRRGREIGRAHV